MNSADGMAGWAENPNRADGVGTGGDEEKGRRQTCDLQVSKRGRK